MYWSMVFSRSSIALFDYYGYRLWGYGPLLRQLQTDWTLSIVMFGKSAVGTLREGPGLAVEH